MSSLLLLKNILSKAFDSKLNVLEKRTKEHIDSLQSTKAIFTQFNTEIETIIKNVTIPKDKPQSQFQLQSQNMTPKSSSSFYQHQRQKNPSQTNLIVPSTPNQKINRSITFTSKEFQQPISNSLTEKKNLSKSKSIKSPTINAKRSLFTRNKTPFNLHKYNNNIPSHYATISPSSRINISPCVRTKHTRHILNITHKPNQIQKELLSIKEQIQNVEHNIQVTEQAIKEKSNSHTNSLLTSPNKQLKHNKSIYHNYLKNKTGILKHIITYLNDKDKVSLVLSSKYYFEYFFEDVKAELINKCEGMNNEIARIKSEYSQIDFNKELDHNKFKLSRGALKASELLDQELYMKVFTTYEVNDSIKEINYIYKIFYQLILEEDFVNIKNDFLFWKKNCEYIIKESNARIGSFLVSQVQYFCFSSNNVYKLKQLIRPIKHKILPSYFSRLCGTTSLIIFLLKDALEYCGVLINENKSHPKHRVDNLTYEKEIIVNLLHQLKHKYTNKFN